MQGFYLWGMAKMMFYRGSCGHPNGKVPVWEDQPISIKMAWLGKAWRDADWNSERAGSKKDNDIWATTSYARREELLSLSVCGDWLETLCKFSWDPRYCKYSTTDERCQWCSVWLRTEEAWKGLEHRHYLKERAMTFSVGDAAWLKNDPDICMTVTGVAAGTVSLAWFAEGGVLQIANLPAEALEEAVVEDNDGSAGEVGAIPPVVEKKFGT